MTDRVLSKDHGRIFHYTSAATIRQLSEVRIKKIKAQTGYRKGRKGD
jgi:hypothetical protein